MWRGLEVILTSFGGPYWRTNIKYIGAKLVRLISTAKNPLKSSNFAPSQAFSLIFVAVIVILQVFSNVEGV